MSAIQGFCSAKLMQGITYLDSWPEYQELISGVFAAFATPLRTLRFKTLISAAI
jgi:hypothetical protein